MTSTGQPGRGLRFLDTVDAEVRAALDRAGRRRRYSAGRVLFREHDASGQVVVVLSGTVKVSTIAATGSETILALRAGGELLGELSALDGLPRSATAIALTKVDTLEIDRAQFLALLRQFPDAALAVTQLVVARLRAADRKRAEFGAYGTATRIVRQLLQLADAVGPASPSVKVHVSQAELAHMVGASRESAARALRWLRAEGLIATVRGAITITDRSRLEALSDVSP